MAELCDSGYILWRFLSCLRAIFENFSSQIVVKFCRTDSSRRNGKVTAIHLQRGCCPCYQPSGESRHSLSAKGVMAFKRTDGRWQSVIWYFDEQGIKRRKVFSSKTKTEAQQKLCLRGKCLKRLYPNGSLQAAINQWRRDGILEAGGQNPTKQIFSLGGKRFFFFLLEHLE